MTEAEWLTDDGSGRQLRFIHAQASVRKLHLIAAALVRRLQNHPGSREAKPCDDLIEAVADRPRPWTELMERLISRPGNWQFTRVLTAAEPGRVAMELRRLVALAPPEVIPSSIELIHEIVGNPFRPVTADPSWLTSTVTTLARQMYESRDFSAMPILADALQDAGCDNADMLAHCRSDGSHVRGCWVIDLLLGKA
jgi:hypothetical protein